MTESEILFAGKLNDKRNHSWQGVCPSLLISFALMKGFLILTPVILVGLIKDLFLWNFFFGVGCCEITFCNIFNLKHRHQL